MAWLVALGCYALAAGALLWPLPTQLFSHLPLGTLPDPVVPWFNLWTLEWNADRLAHAYAGYWTAPIFHPAPDTFLLSEPQPLTGLLFAALRSGFGPIAGYNLTLAVLLVCNGLAMRRLLRVAGASDSSATLAGALAVALPFVRAELGVVQLCSLFPVALGFAELCVLSRHGSVAALWRLGLCWVAMLFSCVYYALFFATLAPLAAWLLLREHVRSRQLGFALPLVVVVVAGLGAPLLVAQHRAVSGYRRGADTIRSGSASAQAYLELSPRSPLGQLLPSFARPEKRRSLFPGVLLLALAGYGYHSTRRRPDRRFIRFAAAAFVVCLVLSFGTRLRLFGVCPYELIVQRWLPGFAQLRSPYRLAAFVQLWLVFFAGLGLDELGRSLRRSGRSERFVLLLRVGYVCVATLEFSPFHAPTQRFPEAVLREPFIAWLAAHPGGAVAMLPAARIVNVSDYEPTVLAMLQALRHGHPIVYGYSGFFPPEADRVAHVLRTFPSLRGFEALYSHQVRYVVIERAWAEQHASDLAEVDKQLRPVYAAGSSAVFELAAR